ncbi:MAG: hypothetical protein ACOH15_08150 [Acetobacterium sp.]
MFKNRVYPKINYLDLVVLGGYVTFFLLNSYLFYAQSLSFENAYPSDLGAHISAGLGLYTNYSLISVLEGWFVRIIGNTIPVALFLASITIMTVTATYYLFKEFFKNTEVNKYLLQLFAFISNFIMAIYLPWINPYQYISNLGPNIYHNSTYLGMKLIGIIVLIQFFRIVDRYLDVIAIKKWLLFAFLLIIANGIKPNFFVFFAPAMFVYLLIDLINAKGKKSLNVLILGSAVLPSLLILVIQYTLLFNSAADGGITIAFGKMLTMVTDHGFLSIVQSLAFPLFVLCFNLKDLYKDKKYGFIWLLLLIALLQYLLFIETGDRMAHGNWGWGYTYAIFFAFTGSIYKLYENFQERSQSIRGTAYKRIAVMLLTVHLLCGIVYYGKLLLGGNFL